MDLKGLQLSARAMVQQRRLYDSQPTVNPDGVEVCTEWTTNDGDIDDSWKMAHNGISMLAGMGSVPGETILACEQPFAYADNDLDQMIDRYFPDAPEVCDEIDNNRSGYIDSEDPMSILIWFLVLPDVDGDNGLTASSLGCDIPSDLWTTTKIA